MSTFLLRSIVVVCLCTLAGCSGDADTLESIFQADDYEATPTDSVLRAVHFQAVSLNGEPVSTGDPVHNIYSVRFLELRQSDGSVIVHVDATPTRKEDELFLPNCSVQPFGVLTENAEGQWFIDENAIIESPTTMGCDPMTPAADVIPIFESAFSVEGEPEGLVLTTDAGDVVVLELLQTSSDFFSSR